MSETVTMTLTEFLLARIAEDEAGAWRKHDVECPDWEWYRQQWLPADDDPRPRAADLLVDRGGCAEPGRVLAECEAKRQAIAFAEAVQDDMERLAPGFADVMVLDKFARILALPYADHPDYREEWA